MPRRFPGIIVFASLAIFSSANAQTPALSFDQTRHWALGTGPSVLGWDFTVTAPIRITALGVWDNPTFSNSDLNGDGFGESHLVGLWRDIPNLTTLASAIIPSGTAADVQNSFRYVAIPAVDLSPGQRYVIGAAYSGAGDWVVSSANNPTFAIVTRSTIVFGNRRSVHGGPALVFPDFVDTEFTGDFGPNFLFTQVPEPSTISLALLAALTILAGRNFPRRPQPSRPAVALPTEL